MLFSRLCTVHWNKQRTAWIVYGPFSLVRTRPTLCLLVFAQELDSDAPGADYRWQECALGSHHMESQASLVRPHRPINGIRARIRPLENGG
ncbi:hypothetical protein PISMIDRAFT_690796 [Pisolithus microcarpus 441]|uniref:Uncharacterized protein n=1 Tax=Pisolithus microcarpus 441 TaxID=765257 RepID=A0A0C9YRR7_9AGAM|nr:hypothetical protein BKA83DRAFT_690796 [Pisolithus microcarpus]KIK10723.1 hypothetical protein PISMIDRAFT_690796 [Pisolithus microcarpus 441]